jgi:23S rRNA pseudouridine1911/1915/1917 synthase
MVKRREVKRTYLALVHGIPETALGTIEAPIGRDPANRKKMAVTADRGRHAITHFELEKSFAEAALLRVELITGRTHQIRVHLSYIGHAVVGDTEYGRRGRLEEKLGLNRQFLHAYRLSFAHPVTGELLEYEEKLPPDLKEAIELIEDL